MNDNEMPTTEWPMKMGDRRQPARRDRVVRTFQAFSPETKSCGKT